MHVFLKFKAFFQFIEQIIICWDISSHLSLEIQSITKGGKLIIPVLIFQKNKLLQTVLNNLRGEKQTEH